MSADTIDKLIWVLIYGGLLGIGLGLAVRRSDDALGWGLVLGGAVVAAIGALLVWVRSRMEPGGDA